MGSDDYRDIIKSSYNKAKETEKHMQQLMCRTWSSKGK
jgi:hypothetical protein